MIERDELKKLVVYAYTALDQTNVADESLNMSVDFILKAAPSEMTLDDVKRIIGNALDTTENKRLNPKWFGDVIRNSRNQGTNQAQDFVESKYPAPQSNGSYDLDTKCNFMTMWAVVYFTTAFKERHQIGANWDIQYRFLVKHGMMAEPEGWLKEWRTRAIEYIKAKELANGSIREVIDSRKAIEQAFDNNTEILNTVYNMRVKDLIYRSQKLSPDEFSNRFNAATSELPAVFIIQDDTKQHFHLQINQ